MRQAIQQLLTGEIKEFTSLYSSNVAGHTQWFSLVALPHHTSDGPRVIIILKDMTSLMQPKEMLQQQVEQLSETNIALNTLLKSREQDRATQEGAIVTNVKQLIMPYLERLHQADLGPQEKTLVTIIGEYLNNIISPFLHHMASINHKLTPQELKVASLIRQVRSSKEISEAMNISDHVVGFHRK
ncbi:MAG: hypothetical protein PF495_15855, partial [Spirochaetales bacterium]|nr:hypothetical protein [Spirochaetales bacterium]